MVAIPRPRPGFLELFEKFKVIDGRQVWVNERRDRFFSWDSLHGEVEAFDKNGRHLGAFHAVTGVQLKEAERSRRIHV